MITLKNLEVYDNKVIAGSPVLFLRDEEGRDWYDSQKLFDDNSLKFVFSSAGVITSKSYDVSTLWPIGNSVAEIPDSRVPKNLDIDGNWMFDGKSIVPRTYTAEEWQTRAEQQRQDLITSANTITADWRTELQLDIISDDDKTILVKWMAYIKAIKALDVSAVKDEASYNAITWPEKPVTK